MILREALKDVNIEISLAELLVEEAGSKSKLAYEKKCTLSNAQ
jgi:hypothetical protein